MCVGIWNVGQEGQKQGEFCVFNKDAERVTDMQRFMCDSSYGINVERNDVNRNLTSTL